MSFDDLLDELNRYNDMLKNECIIEVAEYLKKIIGSILEHIYALHKDGDLF